MHRHNYQGRKFGREKDQRNALIKGLVTSLFEHGAIETTLQKAKDILPYAEALITKAKQGGLHNRRQLISALSTKEVAHKLMDEIAPKLTARDSGHLRVTRTTLRLGDSAQLARISFVDDVYHADSTPVAEPAAKAAKPAPKAAAKASAKGEEK